MKIKFDFVTNSSSTSFVVMGAYISKNDLITEKILNIMNSKLQNSEDILTMKDLEDDPYEALYHVFDKTNLEYHFNYDYGDEVGIGISYNRMGDNETLSEFRERVIKEIEEKLGISVEKVHHIEHCEYNG